jgi:hypothetical protein
VHRQTGRGLAAIAAALLLLAACNSDNKAATTTTAAAPVTTLPPIVYPATNLTVNGFSPGVNQAPFYPAANVSAVTCPLSGTARTVTFTLPPGAAGTSPRTAMTTATTLVISPGKAELHDSSGRVLYRETSATLKPSDHGAVVLAMTNVASADSSGRRVAAGSLNISGDYLCP